MRDPHRYNTSRLWFHWALINYTTIIVEFYLNPFRILLFYQRFRTGVHYYIRYVLTFASIFGVFPVSSIYRRDVYKLTFRWYYPIAIYSFLLLCGFASIELFSLDYTIRNLNQDNLTAKGTSYILYTLYYNYL
ncbi:unnamed protein product [Aphis gossypii]|uniref:Uncharacterized protein n=1 Tax=Aphis gossypii TaxID=80765 RepID=A0A9P0NTT0_APHGO|nr:unnamed protein product [Aphis gossypii]